MIGALGQRPASRKHVAHRPRRGFERLARAGGARIDEVVEQKMAFEQRVGVAGEPNRVGAIMLWESRACDDAGFFVHDCSPSDSMTRRFSVPFTAIPTL